MTTLGNLNTQTSGPTPLLYTKEIQDIYIRKNFQNLVDYFAKQNQLANFNFFEINPTGATTVAQIMNHNLGYTPKDIVVSHVTGIGKVEFLYGSFTSTTISYNVIGGACRVRFFVGTYFNDTSTVTASAADTQRVGSDP